MMGGRWQMQSLCLPLVLGFVLAGVIACEWAPGTIAPAAGRDSESPESQFATLIALEVRREIPVVWAGPSDALPELTDSGFHALHDGHRVTADSNGEALLQGKIGSATCKVYLFQVSSLVKRACPRSSYTGGNTSCLEEGSAVFNGCSDHLIMTPSSEIRVKGSWVSVTYLPDRQLTLVVVSEGAAEVRPVVDFDTRDLGTVISVAPEQLLVTLPDDMYVDEPIRQPLPLDALPWWVQELGIEAWMERVADHAHRDMVPFVSPGTVEVDEGTLREYPGAEVMGPGQLLGDADGDGRCTEVDALTALQMAVGISAPRASMNVNRDGSVTEVDALIILQWAAEGDQCQAGAVASPSKPPQAGTPSTPSLANTPSLRPTPTLRPVPAGRSAPTPVAARTPTPTRTLVPADRSTPPPVGTDTPTPTPAPSRTPTPISTDRPTPTPVPADTRRPVSTDTPTPLPVPADTPTPSPVPTDTPTALPVRIDTPTPSPVPTDTPTPTLVPTDTPTPPGPISPLPTPEGYYRAHGLAYADGTASE